MKYLCYISETEQDFSPAELRDLKQSSNKANAKYGVTGYLWYKNKRFFQYIEGENRVIAQLIKNITEDPRHTILYTLSDELDHRRFPHWSMKFLADEAVQQTELEDLMVTRMEVMSQSSWSTMLNNRVIAIINSIANTQKLTFSN